MIGAKKFPQRPSGIAYNSISVCCYGRAFAKGCVIEAVDALFLETPKESSPQNASIMESLSENLDNTLYFQHIVEVKQPHAMTGPCPKPHTFFYRLPICRASFIGLFPMAVP